MKAIGYFPFNVTPEPQDSTHLDLRKVNVTQFINTYLAASDVDGTVFGDKDVYDMAQIIIKDYESGNQQSCSQYSVEKITNAIRHYKDNCNLMKCKTSAVCTRLTLQKGKLYKILKKNLKNKDEEFVEYIANNEFEHIRSVQRSMLAASIPNVEKHAYLNLDTIYDIAKFLKRKVVESDDPILDFVIEHDIQYNEFQEFDQEMLNRQISRAIVIEKFKENGIMNVDKDAVDLCIEGKLLSDKVINKLVENVQEGSDINALLRGLYDNNGYSIRKEINASDQKLYKDFTRTTQNFLKLWNIALQHDDNQCLQYMLNRKQLILQLFEDTRSIISGEDLQTD